MNSRQILQSFLNNSFIGGIHLYFFGVDLVAFNNHTIIVILAIQKLRILFYQSKNLFLETLTRGFDTPFPLIKQRLEKMLVHNRVKELQKFVSTELFSEIKSVPRWDLIRASLSYVIHCVAVILEKRYVLGMTDQLKPFVIKLLYTLHWILMDAYLETSKPNDPGLYLDSIELFVHMCIPFLSNLHDTDLTHSLKSGLNLWQPLWNHLPPRDTLLAMPVMKPRQDLLSGKEDFFYNVATYFDVALIKVMMLDHWTLYGYRWGLQYLQNHFQSILFRQGFDCENCAVIRAINKFTPRKSFSTATDLQGIAKPENILLVKKPEVFPTMEETPPDHLKEFVNKEGALKIRFVLTLIENLAKNPNNHHLSGSLLFVQCQIVEISLDDQNMFKMLLKHFPSLIFCQIKIMQLFGCEKNCEIGARSKAENYRYLAHGYLKRLIYADKERAQAWFERFASEEKFEEVLCMLHSLFSICDHSTQQQAEKATKRLLSENGNSSQEVKYLENRNSNEKNIIAWVSPHLVKKISLRWKKENLLKNVVCLFTNQLEFVLFNRFFSSQ